MTATSESSKAPDVGKALLRVLPDPGPAISEIEQEPALGLSLTFGESGRLKLPESPQEY